MTFINQRNEVMYEKWRIWKSISSKRFHFFFLGLYTIIIIIKDYFVEKGILNMKVYDVIALCSALFLIFFGFITYFVYIKLFLPKLFYGRGPFILFLMCFSLFSEEQIEMTFINLTLFLC